MLLVAENGLKMAGGERFRVSKPKEAVPVDQTPLADSSRRLRCELRLSLKGPEHSGPLLARWTAT